MKYALLFFLLLLVGCTESPTRSDPLHTLAPGPELACDDCESERDPAELTAVPPTEVIEIFHEATASGPALEIFVFSVGQSDSMLMIGPAPERKALLIDAGEPVRGAPKTNYRRIAQRISTFLKRRHIDYFVASHFHTDHIGSKNTGIAGLLDSLTNPFTIGTFIDPGDEGATFIPKHRGTFEHLNKNLTRWLTDGKVTRHEKAQLGSSQIDLGTGVTVEILASGGKTRPGDAGALAAVAANRPGLYDVAPASENDLSIAIEISFGDFEFFTAGDLTGGKVGKEDDPFEIRSFGGGSKTTYTNVELHMVNHWRATSRESDVEIYRASHHGSGHSTTASLLEELDPEFVIYSCGGGYDHPNPKTVAKVSVTSRQFVTTALAKNSWPRGRRQFRNFRGEIKKEIRIRVAQDGKRYSIEGEIHRAFNDESEKAGEDVDEEEEDRPGEI